MDIKAGRQKNVLRISEASSVTKDLRETKKNTIKTTKEHFDSSINKHLLLIDQLAELLHPQPIYMYTCYHYKPSLTAVAVADGASSLIRETSSGEEL